MRSIRTSCLLVFAGALSVLAAVSPAAAQTLHTRRDVSTLSESEIETLRRGVRVMMSRPATDPTSWSYVTNIHGSTTSSVSPINRCQHGSYFFLSWHRMYIYFFERILRRASGDPNFALPYWNYTDPAQRALPLPFRQPADPSLNPLYVVARQVNDGSALPESAVSIANAFAVTNFSSPQGSGQSFGGQRLSQPSHLASPSGLLERSPHNTVHVAVGGWMSDVNKASRDPIFWLHHANLDRLWKRWLDLGGGRGNPPPSDTVWMNTSFTFIDENGQQVQMTGAQILDTVNQLNYRYDDDVESLRLAAIAPEPPPSTSPPERLPERLVTREEVVELDERAPVHVTIPLPTGAASKLAAATADADQRTLLLDLERIEYEDTPGVYWEIYVNLPASEKGPDPRGPHFVGTLALFGMKPHHHGGAHGEEQPPEGIMQDMDITAAMRAQARRKPWPPDRLHVTFVPRGPMRPGEPGGSGAPPAKGPPSPPSVRIGRLAVIVR